MSCRAVSYRARSSTIAGTRRGTDRGPVPSGEDRDDRRGWLSKLIIVIDARAYILLVQLVLAHLADTHSMSFLPFPFPLLPSFLVLTSAFTIYLLRPLFIIIIARFYSPLRLLPSPPSPSFFLGNLIQLADQEKNDIFHIWTEQYGHTFAYRGFINGPRLFTTDPLALSYILGHAYDFPKPDFIIDALAEMGAGPDGLLTAQGDVHRRQVRLSFMASVASPIS